MAIKIAKQGQQGYYTPVVSSMYQQAFGTSGISTSGVGNRPSVGGGGPFSPSGISTSGVGNRPLPQGGGSPTAHDVWMQGAQTGIGSRTHQVNWKLTPTTQNTYFNDAAKSLAASIESVTKGKKRTNPLAVVDATAKRKNPFVVSLTPSTDLFGLNIPT